MKNVKAMCGICRRTYEEHLLSADGAAMCPPTYTFFSPCKHERKQGKAMLSPYGGGGSDMTCLDCGERFVSGCYASQNEGVK